MTTTLRNGEVVRKYYIFRHDKNSSFCKIEMTLFDKEQALEECAMLNDLESQDKTSPWFYTTDAND
jgi:hypothetical protein